MASAVREAQSPAEVPAASPQPFSPAPTPPPGQTPDAPSPAQTAPQSLVTTALYPSPAVANDARSQLLSAAAEAGAGARTALADAMGAVMSQQRGEGGEPDLGDLIRAWPKELLEGRTKQVGARPSCPGHCRRGSVEQMLQRVPVSTCVPDCQALMLYPGVEAALCLARHHCSACYS